MGQTQQRKSSEYQYFLWDLPNSKNPQELLIQAAARVCQEWKETCHKEILAVFYPYVGLKSTIRIEQKKILLRVSDILEGAPFDVFYALTHVLVARAMRKKPDENYLRIYNEYTQKSEVEKKHAKVRAQKSRKLLMGTEGKYFDLDKIFKQVNRVYFDNKLKKPVLSWSPKRSRRVLGYHDSHLNLVVISRSLDQKSVPAKVLEYIMYHELLHIIIPSEMLNGRRIIHTQEFHTQERKFREFQEVCDWLRGRRN